MSPARVRTLRRITPALFLLGMAVMVAFDRWFTLLAGVGLMLAFVACGVFLIADPGGFLDRDADEDDGGAAKAP
ncbi:MAG: hypothetical protein WC558_02035 [Patulibacter sp.]